MWEGARLKPWRSHWTMSSLMKCSGFWEPGLIIPQTFFLFFGKGPQKRFWLDHSVPSKSWDQIIDPCREHAEVVSLGTRKDKEYTGSCSRNIEADSFLEMACVLEKSLRAREVATVTSCVSI